MEPMYVLLNRSTFINVNSGTTCLSDPSLRYRVEIQKGCVIGRGSRIQSHTFICENVTLGENCFIGHNVTFANDLFHSGAPDPSPDNWISIILGDSVTVGSGAIILSPYICSGAVIGAGAVVVKNIEKKGIYAGNPARLIRTL